MLSRFIRVRLRKEFMHCYPGAPEPVKFLRNMHRHELHVTVTISVNHNDRDLEFIMVKRNLDEVLSVMVKNCVPETSCEDIAQGLLEHCRQVYGHNKRSVAVEVTEDGENGAILSWKEDEYDKNND